MVPRSAARDVERGTAKEAAKGLVLSSQKAIIIRRQSSECTDGRKNQLQRKEKAPITTKSKQVKKNTNKAPPNFFSYSKEAPSRERTPIFRQGDRGERRLQRECTIH